MQYIYTTLVELIETDMQHGYSPYHFYWAGNITHVLDTKTLTI